MPDEVSMPELITYASGKVIRHINSSDSIVERRRQAVKSVRALNEILYSSNIDRMISAKEARFRGWLPERTQGVSIIEGSITGKAKKFEPWIYNDVDSGVMARYIIMLTISDSEGYVKVNNQPYKTDGPTEFNIDLAHSIGPFEEVA